MKRVLCSVLSLIMACGLILPASANNSVNADDENKLDAVDVEVVPYSSDKETSDEPEFVETCRPASNTDIPDEPDANENITWKLYSDGTLIISGSGAITRTCKAQYKPKIRSIIIEPGITSIGPWVFNQFNCVTYVEIPSSVTSIGENAFSICCKLKSLKMEDGIETIDKEAFMGYDNLVSVNIPFSVTLIGERAFSSCDRLQDFYVDKNNNYYSAIDGVLFNKDKTTIVAYPNGKKEETYLIPDSVVTIGNNSFVSNKVLTEVEIPNSVKTIGDCAFNECVKFTTVKIPDSVDTIGVCAFTGCYALTTIEIPGSVVSIGNSAFFWCYGLTEVKISNGTRIIGSNTFHGCSSLTSIEIPNSITTIRPCAFFECDKLSDVYFTGIEDEFKIIDIDENNECLLNANIHYHTHEYTLEINNENTHKLVCSCGDTIIEEHNIQYTSDNQTTHTGKCECGYSVTENHNWVRDGRNTVCSVCGEIMALSGIQNIISNITLNIFNSISKWFPIFGK